MLKVAMLPNDEHIEFRVGQFKQIAKKQGLSVKIYGRCCDKVTAFKETGRTHHRASNSNSICSLKSPQAKYCYAFAVYFCQAPSKRHDWFRI